MRKPRRSAEEFSLSFLDVICCGFGAIILLLMITKIADTFDFAIQSDAAFKADARMLLKRGYVM